MRYRIQLTSDKATRNATQAAMKHETANLKRVRVWDLPVRLFHWLLAALVCVMYLSANFDRFDIHIVAGQAIVGLVLARIAWGFFGSSNLRFSALAFRPGAYASYLTTIARREPGYSVAHSPIGSLAVAAMLAALLIQVVTGLVAVDIDGLIEGPYAFYVSYELSRFASEVHLDSERWLLALIIAHVLANAFYLFYKKDNLILPMIKGFREVPQSVAVDEPSHAATWKSLSILFAAMAAAAAGYLIYG